MHVLKDFSTETIKDAQTTILDLLEQYQTLTLQLCQIGDNYLAEHSLFLYATYQQMFSKEK